MDDHSTINAVVQPKQPSVTFKIQFKTMTKVLKVEISSEITERTVFL